MIILTSSFFQIWYTFSDKCNECERQATHGGYLGEHKKPSSKVIYVRDMAALTGLIISTAPAVGSSARFYNRASVVWWQELVNLCGWGT